MAEQDIDLQKIHDVLIDVARQAGDMITGATPVVEGTGSKMNSADLVTETDKAVEKFVSTTLLAKYPSFSFMGEETYVPGTPLTSSPTFITDPIDGTTNFVHRHPYVSISLGLTLNRHPTIGVVYNPFTHKLYSGIRGHGSYLTLYPFPSPSLGPTPPSPQRFKLPLQNPPPPLKGLDTCLVAIEWGSERSNANFLTKHRTFVSLTSPKSPPGNGAMVHSLRSLGSAALNLCAVAEGNIDVYWEGGCWAWDVCAGWVVLEEAGGRVVGGNKGEWEAEVAGRRYLAVRAAGGGEGEQEALIGEFWGHVQGKLEYET
ncbi:MAG: hypothetical protein Q9160_005384 [Pyrenula sp. 1 TL-2023]